MWARVFQTAGPAFLFIPINTAAYSYLPRENNNPASGLINLARNIGASVCISFVTTMLARRAQFHQTALSAHATAYSSQFNNAVQGLSQSFAASTPLAAQQQAYGQLYGSILRQSPMIAYLDNFWLLGISALVMIPFVFLMKRPPKGVSAAAHKCAFRFSAVSSPARSPAKFDIAQASDILKLAAVPKTSYLK
jgi:DHA2 family multidrug resistance protein